MEKFMFAHQNYRQQLVYTKLFFPAIVVLLTLHIPTHIYRLG